MDDKKLNLFIIVIFILLYNHLMDIIKNILPKDIIKYVIMKYYKYYNSKQKFSFEEIFNDKLKRLFDNILFSNKGIIFIVISRNDTCTLYKHYIYNLKKIKYQKNKNYLNRILYISGDTIISAIDDKSIEIFDTTLSKQTIIQDKPINFENIDKNFVYLIDNYPLYGKKSNSCCTILNYNNLQIVNSIPLSSGNSYFTCECKISDNYLYLIYDYYAIRKIRIYNKHTLTKLKEYNWSMEPGILINNDLLYSIDKYSVSIYNAITKEYLYNLKFKQKITDVYSNDNVVFLKSEHHLWMIKN